MAAATKTRPTTAGSTKTKTKALPTSLAAFKASTAVKDPTPTKTKPAAVAPPETPVKPRLKTGKKDRSKAAPAAEPATDAIADDSEERAEAQFEAEQEAQAPSQSIAEIIMGGGKTATIQPYEGFMQMAMAAAIPDPNPTVRLRITPELARQFLLQTNVNRKIWYGFVSWLAKQIKNGHWNPGNGDTIRFNKRGELIDGQHRLTAIYVSGVAQDCDVKFNLDDEAQATIDTGRKRSVGDQLHLLGEKHSKNLSSAIRWIHIMAIGDVSYRLSTQETVSFLEKNPAIRESVAYVYNSTTPKGTIVSLLAAVHFIAAEGLGLRQRANAFVDVFRSGRTDYEGDPAHKLREMNLNAALSRKVLTDRAHLDNLVHAWNLFRKTRKAARWNLPDKVTFDDFDFSTLGIEQEEPIDVREFLRRASEGQEAA